MFGHSSLDTTTGSLGCHRQPTSNAEKRILKYYLQQVAGFCGSEVYVWSIASRLWRHEQRLADGRRKRSKLDPRHRQKRLDRLEDRKLRAGGRDCSASGYAAYDGVQLRKQPADLVRYQMAARRGCCEPETGVLERLPDRLSNGTFMRALMDWVRSGAPLIFAWKPEQPANVKWTQIDVGTCLWMRCGPSVSLLCTHWLKQICRAPKCGLDLSGS